MTKRGRLQHAEDGGAVAMKCVAKGADARDDFGGPDDSRSVRGRGLVVEGTVRDAEGALEHFECDQDESDVRELGRGGQFAKGLMLAFHRRLALASSWAEIQRGCPHPIRSRASRCERRPPPNQPHPQRLRLQGEEALRGTGDVVDERAETFSQVG